MRIGCIRCGRRYAAQCILSAGKTLDHSGQEPYALTISSDFAEHFCLCVLPKRSSDRTGAHFRSRRCRSAEILTAAKASEYNVCLEPLRLRELAGREPNTQFQQSSANTQCN